MTTTHFSFAVALAAIACMTAPAWAATEAPATSKWVKVCEDDSCNTMQRIVGPNGDLVASITIRHVKGDPKVQLVVSMPLGMNIKTGLAVRIDDKVNLPMKFNICMPAGCYAQGTSDKALVDALKSGGKMLIVAESRGKPIALPITLAGFTKAFDGKGDNLAIAKSKFAELAKADIAAAQARIAELKEKQAAKTE
jgi:invasion protein IalB